MDLEPSTTTRTRDQQAEAIFRDVDGPAPPPVGSRTQHAGTVRAARDGHIDAWESLVHEYSRMLWATARRYRLNDAQAADAVQMTWLRLLERVDDIRDPERLAGWLATTAQRICLQTARGAERCEPVQDPPAHSAVASMLHDSLEDDGPEQSTLRREHVALLREVLAELPERHQRLMRLLMSYPSPTYRDVAAQLGIPVGSIGPTRARILARLRTGLSARGLDDLVLA